jgi:phage terminase large subunit-like protein
VTTAGGSRYATSVGGALTGRGADLIIVDDPLKAEEAMSEQARKRVIEWYAGTLVSRLNDKENGPIIVVMQRLHENDLAGHLLDQGGWEHLDLPSIALEDSVIPLGRKVMTRQVGDILHPERESNDALDRIKAEIGSLQFSAQYQQRPVPLEGNLVRRDWFRHHDHLPQDSANRIVQSWDIAMMTGDTNDYSVCTTWRMIKRDYYLLDVFRARLQYPDLRRKVARIAAKRGAGTILIENAGPGMALLQDLWRDLPQGMTRPIGRKPEGSKADRMVAQSAKIEAGHVHSVHTGLHIDHGLVFGRRLHRQIGRLGAAQDTIDTGRRHTELIRAVGTVAHKPTGCDEEAVTVHGGQAVPCGKRDDEIAVHDGVAIRGQ